MTQNGPPLSLKRRTFISGLLSGAAAVMTSIRQIPEAVASRDAANHQSKKVIILHTNDLHGHLTEWQGFEGPQKDKAVGGVACLASAIKKVREESAHVLLLDAGDLIGVAAIRDRSNETADRRAFCSWGHTIS